MKRIASIVLTATAAVMSSPAMAQFQKPDDAVKYRKAAFTLMAAHFSRVGAMASGRAPFDAQVAQDNAALAETLGKLPWAGFVPGTDRGQTRAKPEIWTEQAKFQEGAQRMQKEMAALAAATKTGNLDAIKAAFGPAQQSCKACHDAYRKD